MRVVRTLNTVAKRISSRLLAISIVLLCLPADIVCGVWLVGSISRLTGSGVVLGRNQPVPAVPSEGWAVAGFLELLDFEVVHSFGVQACLAAIVLWLLLLAVGEKLPTKLLTLGCLLLAVAGTVALRRWPY